MIIQRILLLSVWDASVKVPLGVEYGTIYQFGQFDECMEFSKIQSQHQTVKSQYCLANVEIEGMVVRRLATRKERVSIVINFMCHGQYILPILLR